MKNLLNLSAFFFCALICVQAKSGPKKNAESETCISLGTALEQAIATGSFDPATFPVDQPLTSLLNRLSNFRERVITGETTSVSKIEKFVEQLRSFVGNVFNKCDLSNDLLEAAFEILLQDLIKGIRFLCIFLRCINRFVLLILYLILKRILVLSTCNLV